MEFVIAAVVVGAIGWMLFGWGDKRRAADEPAGAMPDPSAPPNAPPTAHPQTPRRYDSMQELPPELRDVVLRIMQTPWDSRSTERQQLREQLKDTEYHLRNKHALRWNGEESGPLPIRTLSHHQHRVLLYAATLHAIQIDREESIELNRNVFAGPKRTVQSLLKHGMLRLDEYGVYRITQLGLQALETLSVRFD